MPTKDVFFAVVMIDSAPLFPRFSIINPHNSQDKVFCVVNIVQSKQVSLKTRLGIDAMIYIIEIQYILCSIYNSLYILVFVKRYSNIKKSLQIMFQVTSIKK